MFEYFHSVCPVHTFLESRSRMKVDFCFLCFLGWLKGDWKETVFANLNVLHSANFPC